MAASAVSVHTPHFCILYYSIFFSFRLEITCNVYITCIESAHHVPFLNQLYANWISYHMHRNGCTVFLDDAVWY